jgi:hypothetical protein
MAIKRLPISLFLLMWKCEKAAHVPATLLLVLGEVGTWDFLSPVISLCYYVIYPASDIPNGTLGINPQLGHKVPDVDIILP